MCKFPTSLSSLIVIVIVTNCVICWSHVEAIKHFPPSSSGEKSSLHQDLCDFLNVIPVEDIRNLTKHFYANDKDMRGSYDYLRDEGYRKIVEKLSQISIFKKFTSFLNDSGVNFAELRKKIEKFVLTSEETDSIAFVGSYGCVAGDAVDDVNEGKIVGGESSEVVDEVDNGKSSSTTKKKKGLGGINSFVSETLLLIPQEEVLTLFFAKMEESAAFSSFLERLSTNDYENLFENLKQSHGLQMLYFDLHSHGIDVLEWAKSLRGFFGY